MAKKAPVRTDFKRTAEAAFPGGTGTWYLPARQSRPGVILCAGFSRPEALADLAGCRVFAIESPGCAKAACQRLKELGYDRLVLCGSPRLAQADLVLTPCAILLTEGKFEQFPAFCLPPEPERCRKRLDKFLDRHLSPRGDSGWMPLDNAAKIYPAARRRNWSSLFRISATLTEPIDCAVMQAALDITVHRFPSICARLSKGLFWYYLQPLDQAPLLTPEAPYPMTRMSLKEIKQCAMRVLVFENRVALEVFHSLTDGTGAMTFLKSLLAEYLNQKHGLCLPPDCGIPDRMAQPQPEELEDSFQKYSAPKSLSRKQSAAWRQTGTPEKDGWLNQTCFRLPIKDTLAKAKEYGVSLTAFMTAVMMDALQRLQAEEVPNRRRRKNIKVQVPVNLRALFPSRSIRNFAMYTTPEIIPKLGHYSFPEICAAVHHRMGLEVNAKHMGMMIAANIGAERLMAVRLMPLFIKNAVMKIAFNTVGENTYCLALSNLGKVTFPEQMAPYIHHMDLVLGAQATAPYNCGMISWGQELRVNFIRSIRESRLEYHFHRALQDLGLVATVESNRNEVL